MLARSVGNILFKSNGSNLSGSDGWSISEKIMEDPKRIDCSWLHYKDEGNKEFKKGNYDNAINLYNKALCIATSPKMQSDGLFLILKSMQKKADESSAIRLVLENQELVDNIILSFLPKSPNLKLKDDQYDMDEPNLPAAICLANMATCQLKNLDLLADAADNANLARIYCPEYLKGHEKLLHILELTNFTEEAKNIQHQLQCYQAMINGSQWNGPALHFAGWIDRSTLSRYESSRREDIIQLCKKKCPRVFGVISLVPYVGGQWLVFSLKPENYPFSVPFESIDLFAFISVDTENDDLLAMSPPRASDTALSHSIHHLDNILHQLKSANLHVISLTCCQGFLDHTDVIKHSLCHHNGLDVVPKGTATYRRIF
mmetsp:Transcript_21420/g.32861  ORF Transcript_21420/g.32861 Transcript_21420/m.32861 type:complete len:373 (+) Transcript_21420:1111-2229(+)